MVEYIAHKIIGSKHIKENIVCQDAYCVKKIDENNYIFSVADGHGSNKSYKSHLGSQSAVDISCKIFSEMTEEILLNIKSKELLDLTITRLFNKIIKEWKDNIIALENENFNDFIVYGTTLLNVFINKNFILYLQVGDGDIVSVKKNINVVKRKVLTKRTIIEEKYFFEDNKLIKSKKEIKIKSMGIVKKTDFKNPIFIPYQSIQKRIDYIANETASLCLKNPIKYLDYSIEFNKPEMIIISTDGYSNAYGSQQNFFDVCKDYYKLIKEYGISKIDTEVESWMREASNKSGDDITFISILLK